MTSSRLPYIAFSLALFAGTGCDDPTPEARPTNTEEPEATRSPEDLDHLVARICAGQCAGPFSRITLYGDAEGALRRVRFDGDLQVCSHPPRIYYDESGAQTLVVAERPVTTGEEAARLAAEQDAQTEGLTELRTLRCPLRVE